MMDCTFARDLEKPPHNRIQFKGAVFGFDFTNDVGLPRMYIQIEDPPVEIKVYFVDLNEQACI